MMKRSVSLFILLIMLFCFNASSCIAETGPGLPAVFRISYKTAEREVNGNSGYIYKEYLITSSDMLNSILADTADLFEKEYMPLMPTDTMNPKRNNRLDIHMVSSRTGTSWMSVLVLCRQSVNRIQKRSPFFAITWDLSSDRRILLTDLFEYDSDVWSILSQGAREQMNAYYPEMEADPESLDRLCSIESISNAAFTLHAEELTLHFSASELYPNQTGLMHIRFFYTYLRPYMTELGQLQTDNSAYPKAALTFDDGPAYTETASILNNLRKYGARGTFFVVGGRVDEFKDILHRTFDENNLVESHTNAHNDASKQSQEVIRRTVTRSQTAISNVVGASATMMRPPYGVAAPYSRSKVGLPIVMWNLDTMDWTGKSPSAVISTVKSKLKNGDIILMHDIKTNTIQSSELVAAYLYEQGYMMVSVDELMLCGGVEMKPNSVYYRCQDGAVNDDSY